MKKLHYMAILLISSTALFATVSQRVDDTFFNGDFEKVIHFNALHFTEGNQLDENSLETFHRIEKRIDELKRDSKDFKVTVVGHNYNEDGYYYKKLYRNNKLQIDSKSSDYANFITKKLVDDNISAAKIATYAKGGTILGYTDEDAESAALSNRVMVSLYLLPKKDIDSDGDGVFDRYDVCANTPKGVKVDKDGCPYDSDHDGVLDYKDKCPNTPTDISVDANGCPYDSDNDGVVDYKDKCKNTPLGAKVDVQGCQLQQTLKLNFQRNSDKILKESYPVVKKFAEFLKANPNYKVEITGHTDSRGKAGDNMKLSLKRAQMVKEALVSEGIDASRITTKGRGELDPIATNRTKEGRAKNRRIEVKLFQ